MERRADGTPVSEPTGTSARTGQSNQGGNPTSETAKGEARQVGQEGAEAGQHVADVAKDDAKGVAEEAKGQAKGLAHTLGDDLKDQAGTQQKKVADNLHSISDELRSMAKNSEQQGMATQWVQEAASRTGDAAGWLDQRDPGSLLDETKRFARNRPGAFLAIAAGAGLVAGRLARGMKGASSDSQGSNTGHSGGSQHGSTYNVPPPPHVAPGVGPNSGAATASGGAAAGMQAAPPGTGGSNPGTYEPTAREDQAMPDMASTYAPGYRPGFPDSEPAPTNPAYPNDNARGLNEGGDKR